MNHEPIAILGAACRFPGAPSPEAFWSLLREGRQAIGRIGPERWATAHFGHPRQTEPGKSYSWSAGLLERVDTFDPAFFGISVREAEQMDPQQRLLLELGWEAVEDAGIAASRLRGAPVGVFVGASATEYANLRYGDLSSADAYFMTGNTLSIFANRLSYFFDFRGPSLAIDTACSSSLIALHVACEHLSAGRIEMAMVGGVNLLLSPFPFVGFSRAGMLSRQGQCFTFDARADGYVRGEGGGMVLLKPLRQALAAGDAVRAVIVGSGTNADGRTVGLSLPSQDAQTALLTEVYARAGVDPSRLSFIEAHGTGTPAGDPIEAAALGRALARHRTRLLPVGSVKTNIGHLEAASGMAGLIKAMLALERRELPPSLNFETPNPAIDFEGLGLAVAQQTVALDPTQSLVAGISGFGFGGTNAHIVLATAPEPVRASPQIPEILTTGDVMPPLLLSARSAAALTALASDWGRRLSADTTASDRSHETILGAARSRDHHPHRLVVLPDHRAAMAASLERFAAAGADPGIVCGLAVGAVGIAFVFSGNGAQYPGMARQALADCPAFRAAVAEVDAALQGPLGWSVLAALEGAVEVDLARTDVAQPMLFAVQIGIAAALAAEGIRPAAVAGHSVGEIAAAFVCGSLGLADAAHLVAIRSRHQQRTVGAGRMAAVGAAADAVLEAAAAAHLPLEIAAYNAPQAVTVTARLGSLEALRRIAKQRRWAFSLLDLDYAFHSEAMSGIEAELVANLADLRPSAETIPFVSTVTGEAIPGTALDSRYWWRNIRDPVLFAPAIDALARLDIGVFLEVGPSPVLQSYLRDCLKAGDRAGRPLPSLTRGSAGADHFGRVAASCYVAGARWWESSRFDGFAERRDLPRYPWQRERHWYRPTTQAVEISNPPQDHPLLGVRLLPGNFEWIGHLDTLSMPWLAEHRVDGVAVLPAAAMIDLALAAGRVRHPDAECLELRGLEVRRVVVLDPDRMRELRSRFDRDGEGFGLEGRTRMSEDPWTEHLVVRIAVADHDDAVLWADAEPCGENAISEPGMRIAAGALYTGLAAIGLDYGPTFRRVREVRLTAPDRALVVLDPVDDMGAGASLFDPRLLDAAFHGVLALLADGTAGGSLMLPWRVDRVRCRASGGVPCRASLHLVSRTARTAVADLVLLDAAGTAIARLDGCAFRAVARAQTPALQERSFSMALVPAPLAEPPWRVAPAKPERDEGAPPPVTAEAALLARAFVLAAMREALIGRLALESSGISGEILRILERHDLARATATGWQLAETAEMPESSAIWRSLFYDAPAEAALAAALAWSAERLEARLDGAATSGEIPQALRDRLLFGPQTARLLVRAICRAPIDRQARPLKILELDTSRGLLARQAIRLLAVSGLAARYVIATKTVDETRRAIRSVGATPSIDVEIIDWAPGETATAALEREGFDVVVAAYGAALGQLRVLDLPDIAERLAPSGRFLALEPERDLVWPFIFGDGVECAAERAQEPQALRDACLRMSFGMAVALPQPGQIWPLTLIEAEAKSIETRAGGQPASAEAAQAPHRAMPRLIVVIAEVEDLLARSLAQEAERHGFACRLVNRAANPPQFPVVEADAIVVLPWLPRREADSVLSATQRLDEAALATRAAATVGAALWLVTRGAFAGPDAPAEAAITGFGRVAANEYPMLACRRLDLSPDLPNREATRAILEEIEADSADRETVWNAAGRHVPRLRWGLPQVDGADPTVVLDLAAPGSLNSLGWRHDNRRLVPGAGEIAIAVSAAGLNFRDVMWAMALLPDEALRDGFAGPALGMECAGVVTEVGFGVDGFEPGDRVMAFAPACLASRVVTRAACAARLPDAIDFASGATMPVAFLTVIYALGHLAQVTAGETVLIHGGAGAVGLAAIQYAKHRGARIVATAGSPAKRAMLRLAGVDLVLDSRSLRFADEAMRFTDGRGIDVVLNSLSGEAMERSLGTLGAFGRFIELGKRDFYQDTRIGLRAVRHNVTYFAVDADELVARRPQVAAAVLAEMQTLFAAGALRPLPYLAFPFCDVAEAFQLMRNAGHVGKIVLLPDGVRPATGLPRLELRAEATYLVAGGFTGFGLAAAHWLVRQGARHLALLGRRGAATPDAQAALAGLYEAGALSVRPCACDISDAARLGAVLSEIRSNMPPIAGIVHAAMALEDGLIERLGADAIARVLAPKLGGAEHLDRLTRDDPVELFLLFSSATTTLGSPGQAAYVAANMALEALARRRRAEGLPALAVAWGPIADVGYLANRAAAREALARRLGAVALRAEDALDQLPALLASGLAAVTLAEVDWAAGQATLPILGEPIFTALASQAESRGLPESSESLAGKSPEALREIVENVLLDEIGGILRLPRASLDLHKPLAAIGMDSLMAVELKLALERRLGLDVPSLALSDSMTAAALASRLVASLAAPAEAAGEIALAAATLQQHAAEAAPELVRIAAAAIPTTAPMGASPRQAAR